MGKNSAIDWTDHTWNPWQGCHRVSPGCANCYMFRDKKRFGQNPTEVVRSSLATFRKPLSWREPAKVFVCSWSDFFIEEADQWRDEAWQIIRDCPHLTFQILTKRPENIEGRIPADRPLRNVWLGVTAETQAHYNARVPYLIKNADAAVIFVSVEPMLGPICDLHSQAPHSWVICGGESGPNARTMRPIWAEHLKAICEDVGTPFFMKQMSGTDKNLRRAIPDYLNVREFPEPRR